MAAVDVTAETHGNWNTKDPWVFCITYLEIYIVDSVFFFFKYTWFKSKKKTQKVE